jgi:pilus assembly protein CpaB
VALKLNRYWLVLAGAIALGGLAFYLSNKAINQRISEIEAEANRGKTTVRVVVAKHALRKGDALNSSTVAVRQIPSEFVNGNMVTPETFDTVKDQPLTVNLERGEPVMTAFTASRGGEVFAATLKEGRRALTIEVDEISSFSGMLRPGDRIDLMLTAKPSSTGTSPDAKEFTFPMLSNVEVLATGQIRKDVVESSGESVSRSYSTVTLNLAPQDATRVIAAKTGGKLTAVLRAPSDQVANPSHALTIDDVVASVSRSANGDGMQFIEVIIGGSGGKVNRAPVLGAAMENPRGRAVAEQVARLQSGDGDDNGHAVQARQVQPQAQPQTGGQAVSARKRARTMRRRSAAQPKTGGQARPGDQCHCGAQPQTGGQAVSAAETKH